MTRFARAEGSKGSNKRKHEEATPWNELKLKTDAKKMKKKKLIPSVDNSILKNYDEYKLNPLRKKKIKGIDDGVTPSIEETKPKSKLTGALPKKHKCVLKKNKIVEEDGKQFKIFKGGKKKPWYDIPYEENEVMTKFDKFFVKRTAVPQLENFKKLLEDQDIDDKKKKNVLLHEERKAHNKLHVELLREQISKDKPEFTRSHERKKKGNFIRTAKTKFNLTLEENEVMTKYGDYWVLRENVYHLDMISELKKMRILKQRTDGNTSKEPTQEEELVYRRLMKKEMRREERLLKRELIKNAKIAQRQHRQTSLKKKKPGKPGKYLGIKMEEGQEVIRFDGYLVRREGAQRLERLKEQMKQNGCSNEEIHRAIKSVRRHEERAFKRENKVFCFRCRVNGHMITSCPLSEKEGMTNIELCFKCGSAEHMARNCPDNKTNCSFSYAKCFICDEVGHISRECPDNPRGLYPNGGCCNECGSVEHLKRDCPELQKRFEEDNVKLPCFVRGQEMDALDEQESGPSTRDAKKVPKHIVFD